MTALLALAGSCAKKPTDLTEALGCATVDGAEALLSQPSGGFIVVDGDSSAAEASRAIGCLAAARGEHVVWGAEAQAATTLAQPVENYAQAGAEAAVFQFEPPRTEPPARTPDEERDRILGEARGAAFAAAVDDARALAADRLILVVTPPDGARAPVGLSGHTWRPLGARLPASQTISLRAERSARPGIRVRLMPFEDVPERGAALRYDGIIEVGPPTQQTASTQSTSVTRR
ncbi:MAG: hypothetical protein AB7O04_06385 [Hyphomonadaceae bacterium]